MFYPLSRSLLFTSTTLLVLMTSASLAQNNTTASALIYSATADFRHDSIPTAIEALKAQGSSYNIQFDNTEDASWFTDDKLARYDLLVFLMNTGEGKYVTRLVPVTTILDSHHYCCCTHD